jgi:hypothetical protein
MKMEQTVCSEKSAYKISDAGELPRRKHTISLIVFDPQWLLSLCVASCVVLYVFFWVISPAPELYTPKFRNTLFRLRTQIGVE